MIVKERKYKSVPENRWTDHLIFATPWSKVWGVPHRQAERDEGLRPDLSSTGRDRMKELERENRELRRANEIIRKAAAFFAQA